MIFAPFGHFKLRMGNELFEFNFVTTIYNAVYCVLNIQNWLAPLFPIISSLFVNQFSLDPDFNILKNHVI